jgi:hypothetical protein
LGDSWGGYGDKSSGIFKVKPYAGFAYVLVKAVELFAVGVDLAKLARGPTDTSAMAPKTRTDFLGIIKLSILRQRSAWSVEAGDERAVILKSTDFVDT